MGFLNVNERGRPPSDLPAEVEAGALAGSPTGSTAPPPVTPDPDRRRHGTERRRTPDRSILALVAVVLLAALLVTLHVREYTVLSPIDELQHLDYALKVSDGDLVYRGDRVGTEALREEACRGVDGGYPTPPCGARTLRPADFQEEGYNTAYVHTPGYYLVAGLGGRLIDRVPGVMSPVVGARLMGALWLAAALVLMWMVFDELGVRLAARLPVLLLVACAPTVLHAAATVNPDGSAVAIGSAALLVVLRWESGRARPWLLAFVGVAAILTKVNNVVAVGVAVLYLGIRWYQQRASGPVADPATDGPNGQAEGGDVTAARGLAGPARSGRATAGAVAALALSVAVAGSAWMLFSSAKARVDADEIPMTRRFLVDSVSVDELVDNLPAGLTPLRDAYIPAIVATPLTRVDAMLGDRLLLIGVAASLIVSRARSRERALATAAMLGMIVVGPMFVGLNYLTSSIYVGIPPRYGLAVVPAAAAATGLLIQRSRLGLIVAAVVSGVGAVGLLAALS
jgi:hypothetical protein